MNFIDNTSWTSCHPACPASDLSRPRREYRPRILVVGSLNPRVDAFARMLRRWRYAISLCDSGYIDSSTLRGETFDLVVVCLERMDFDVWDSLDCLRRICPSLPLVILRENPEDCSWVEVGGTSWILKTQLTMAQTQLLFHELAGVPAGQGRAPSIRGVDRAHGPFLKAATPLRSRPRWSGFGSASSTR